jgi:hypothetical protein
LLGALSAGACGDATLDLVNPDVGLLGHWALDEAQSGAVVVDSSGFGLDGTPSQNPPLPAGDIPPVHFTDSRSLSFNGQDQWVLLGNPPLLNAGGATSIAAWIRPTSVDGYRDILAHGYRTAPDQELALRINGGKYQFIYWDGMDHAASADIPATDVGTWVHLCGVFGPDGYRLFRNGQLAGMNADATSPPPNIEAPWGLGARPMSSTGPDRFMQGNIDDVRVYGRALSATEVQALYHR